MHLPLFSFNNKVRRPLVQIANTIVPLLFVKIYDYNCFIFRFSLQAFSYLTSFLIYLVIQVSKYPFWCLVRAYICTWNTFDESVTILMVLPDCSLLWYIKDYRSLDDWFSRDISNPFIFQMFHFNPGDFHIWIPFCQKYISSSWTWKVFVVCLSTFLTSKKVTGRCYNFNWARFETNGFIALIYFWQKGIQMWKSPGLKWNIWKMKGFEISRENQSSKDL